MPRASVLTLAVVAALTAAADARAQSGDAECDPLLSISTPDNQPDALAVTLGSPCTRYVPVTFTYGPLTIREETGLDGFVALRLPRLDGLSAITAQVGDVPLSAAIPPGPQTGYVAVDWAAGPRWGRLVANAPVRALGFRGTDGATHVDLAATGGPVALDVPVTADSCGRTVSALLATDRDETARPLTVSLPGCSAAGETVRVPLR